MDINVSIIAAGSEAVCMSGRSCSKERYFHLDVIFYLDTSHNYLDVTNKYLDTSYNYLDTLYKYLDTQKLLTSISVLRKAPR